ncbi:sulfotransferase family protein [Amycolatopsis magusensis]|uniref:sulfotransferase family protein n=1 Tax=Amycolatopsis magusensis TaxID=882444 RepID=UPI0037885319
MVEVIGAGFGRTGTMSLHSGLETLGYAPCHHMKEVLGNPGSTTVWAAALRGDREALRTAVEGYRGTLDFPSCLLWREMMELFPDAKVLLSVRDPESWYHSAAATIFNPVMEEVAARLAANDDAVTTDMMTAMAEHGFGDHGKDETIAWFVQHNKDVMATVPEDKLLVYQVSDGWEPLCEFLGAAVPQEPFPRVNDSADFAENVDRFLSDGSIGW